MAETVTNALKGKRVVVTRAAEQSKGLVSELKERGAAVVMLPMVAFGPPDNVAFLDQAIRQMQSYDWVFLTSQNALRAIQERCATLKLTLEEAFGGVKIAAVGPATADVVETAGLKVSYVASKHKGEALAEELAEHVQSKRVLLPRSDRANPELVEALKRNGSRVFEVCAYKTLRAETNDPQAVAKIVERGADAVLFFSPSAAQHLRDALGKEKFLDFSRQSVFTAIGPVTEECLRNAGVERVVLSRDTTSSAVVETLADYFAARASIQL